MDCWKSICVFGCDRKTDKNRQSSFESDYNSSKNEDNIKNSKRTVDPKMDDFSLR